MLKVSNYCSKHIGQILYLGVLLSCLFISSCDIANPEEELPAYLKINNFNLNTINAQGAASEQITDAWVFVNEVSLGIYELPASVPVLALGEQNISIFPVIRENALRSTPIIYPFYERYEISTNLEAEQTVIIQPSTSYILKSTVFELIEDFEDSHHRLDGGNPDAVKIINTPSKVLSGNGAGQILLNGINEIEFTSSATFLDLSIQGNLPVFLEIDYKTNVEFEIGLVGLDPNPTVPVSATNYKVTLCPIDKWNKIYINFQEDLAISQLPGYKLAFRISSDNTGCGKIAKIEPEVLIDNIKFIRFTN